MSNIYVIGSMSVDLVTEMDRAPKKGETILGSNFFMTLGGKGANQAVAASRLGGSVYMVGCVGDDQFGQMILNNFKDNDVNIDHVETIPHTASGTATILLSDYDNSIIVVPSANHHLTVESVDSVLAKLTTEDIVVLQNEIPLEVIEHTINYCYEANIRVIYNPAPYIDIDRALLNKTTYFTPNETEVEELFGKDYRELIADFKNQMIVTVGSEGAVYFDEELVAIQANKTEVVDTTGAGDTFNGALAVAISEGMTLDNALQFSNKAAGISVTGLGAQGGMPYRKELI